MISINILKEIITEILSSSQVNNTCENVYLFGSSIYHNNPSDIDILYIYETSINSSCYEQAIHFRRMLSNRILDAFNIPADVILLSSEEEKELSYLSRIRFIKLH